MAEENASKSKIDLISFHDVVEESKHDEDVLLSRLVLVGGRIGSKDTLAEAIKVIAKGRPDMSGLCIIQESSVLFVIEHPINSVHMLLKEILALANNGDSAASLRNVRVVANLEDCSSRHFSDFECFSFDSGKDSGTEDKASGLDVDSVTEALTLYASVLDVAKRVRDGNAEAFRSGTISDDLSDDRVLMFTKEGDFVELSRHIHMYGEAVLTSAPTERTWPAMPSRR